MPVVYNPGNEPVNYSVALRRNGSVETIRMVEVGPGETREVPVTVTATTEEAGTTVTWQAEDESVNVTVTDG